MSFQFFRDEMFPDSDSRTMSIGDFEHKVDSEDLVVPLYQRNLVWTKKDEQGYLRSISKGYPLFGPVININMDTGMQYIMDGQNRLFTIYKFLKGKIPFKEAGETIYFSDLPDNQKRRFRIKTISYLETRGWSDNDCQEFFVAMNGGGVKLKSGELIHADRENILSKTILDLSGEYVDLLASKASDGGFHMTPGCLQRYGHYEILGTLFHMTRTNEFPIRPGKTSLEELETWRSEEEPTDIFQETLERMRNLMNQHIRLMLNVPRLRQKVAIKDHLRIMFFLLRTDIYLQTLDESHYSRFEFLLNRVLNKDGPDYHQIIKWGTGNCMQIYELYRSIYFTEA